MAHQNDNDIDHGATDATSVTLSGTDHIDALVGDMSETGGGSKWTDHDISFSFITYEGDYGAAYDDRLEPGGFSALSARQEDAARFWFDEIAAVADVSFTEYTGAAGSTSEDQEATIRFGNSDAQKQKEDDDGNLVTDGDGNPVMEDVVKTAYAWMPFDSEIAGDVWLGGSGGDPDFGDYDFMTIGHEIGHTMGLHHGHDESEHDDDGAVTEEDHHELPSGKDSIEYSIMTYNGFDGDDASGYNVEASGFSQSLMMYDIAALQYLYGADYDTNSGDTTYGFNFVTGQMSINGVAEDNPATNNVFRTIWDGNGEDTYDFSNHISRMRIDLRPGEYSDLNVGGNHLRSKLGTNDDGDAEYARGHVYNALQHDNDDRSLIENAKGGMFDDLFYGNKAANDLYGGAGGDFFYGGAGNDRIFGGVGDDDLRGGTDADSLYGGADDDVLHGSFGNDILDGGAGFNTVYGGADNDTLRAGAGFNHFDGGDGTDTLDTRGWSGAYDVNLSTGQTSWANETVTSIENVVTGGGDDRVVGNRYDNAIETGAGSDSLYGAGGDDVLIGGAGSDVIYGGDDDDHIFGGGDDLIDGGDGIDTFHRTDTNTDFVFNMLNGATDTKGYARGFENFVGANGDHIVFGTDEDNEITTGAGADEIRGGGGRDVIDAGGFNDTVDGGMGYDELYGGAGLDTVDYGFWSGKLDLDLNTGAVSFHEASPSGTETARQFENVISGKGDARITGTDGANVITTMGGDDIVETGYGMDDIDTGAGDDTVSTRSAQGNYDGGDGRDMLDLAALGIDTYVHFGSGAFGNDGTLQYGFISNFEDVVTGDGDDNITGSEAANRIEAGSGDNFVWASGGDDLIETGGGSDEVFGGAGHDTILTGHGADTVYANDGDDRVEIGFWGSSAYYGGDGEDTILGNLSAAYTVKMAAGTIQFLGRQHITAEGFEIYDSSDGAGNGGETVLGGVGRQVIHTGIGDNVVKGGGGRDMMYGGSGDDLIVGHGGRDVLIGDDGEDRMVGGLHNDILKGGADADFLNGHDGDDRLFGGAGDDRMIGGAGEDVFAFVSPDSGRDNILDFTYGEDLIDLSRAGVAGFDELSIEAGRWGAEVGFGQTTLVLNGIDAQALIDEDFIFA